MIFGNFGPLGEKQNITIFDKLSDSFKAHNYHQKATFGSLPYQDSNFNFFTLHYPTAITSVALFEMLLAYVIWSRR